MDLLRLIAVLLVMIGHFFSVGNFAPAIPGIINEGSKLPILDHTLNSFWKIDIWFINNLNSQTAIVGVLLFFLITGYLIAMMQEKYSPMEFLINRFYRLFPVLVICTIIVSVFVYITQGITFRPISYFASFTLSYEYLFVAPVMGVLWTLAVETLFYIVAAIVGKLNNDKIYLIYSFILCGIFFASEIQNQYLSMFVHTLKFIAYILIGSSIYNFNKNKNYKNALAIISSFVISYTVFEVYQIKFGDTTTYANFGSQFTALCIFSLAYTINLKWGFIYDRLPRFVIYISDIVYPFYLLHAVFGLGTMYSVAQITDNQYMISIAGILSSLVISGVVHELFEKKFIQIGKSRVSRIRENIKIVTSEEYI